MTKTIGRYQLLEKLGEGSMSLVYKAFDPKINRVLAIKFLRDERSQSHDYRSRFVREAKAVGTLSHPNIVTVFDVGEIESRPFIAMECIEGIPLNVAMKSGVKLSVPTVIRLGIQIAEALHYAHEKGIVHRDVKPSNILLLNSQTECKITDFGIAHIDAQEVTYQTQVGEMLGTPQYMSPEQVLGKKVDARSDLFSLGVILYQLLSGKKPFDAPSVANVLFKIATETPQPIGQVAPHLPHTLKQAVDRLLKKQPEKRFQSGKELAEHLTRILHNIESQPTTATASVSRSGRWPLALSLAGIVSSISLTALSYWQTQKHENTVLNNYGQSLAQIISYQLAEPLLAQDWPHIELFSHDVAEKQHFDFLFIVDHSGVVRGSSDATLIGKPLDTKHPIALPNNENTPADNTDNHVGDFHVPIHFGSATIGQVHIGLSRDKLMTVEHDNELTLIVGAISTLLFLIGGIVSTLPNRRSLPSADEAVEKPTAKNLTQS